MARIIVVDDEPDFTMLVRAHLESLGHFNVHEENDSTNAVRAAREFDPDLILLDIMMPEMDGSEVAAHLCADSRLADVPVIFLTALVQKPSGTPEPRNWNPSGYMKKKEIPKDPWGNDYQYIRYPDGRFDLLSYGADGREGGEEYDADLGGESK